MATVTIDRREVMRADLAGKLEHAPADPGKVNPDIAGWGVGYDLFLCWRCAGRIFARGCRVEGRPVWKDEHTEHEACCLCGADGM